MPAKCSPLTDNNSSPLLHCLLVFDFASFPDSTSKIRMWSLLSFFTYIDKKKYKAFTLRRKYEMKIVFLIWLEFLLITVSRKFEKLCCKSPRELGNINQGDFQISFEFPTTFLTPWYNNNNFTAITPLTQGLASSFPQQFPPLFPTGCKPPNLM